MVDDILLSPEEQDERAKRWLKDNGPALVIGVALGLAAVFGYNSYQDHLRIKAETASALYDSVMNAVSRSDIADIEASVQTLKDDHAGSSYAAKAVLIHARQLAASDLNAALAELQWVAANSKEIGVNHTARIRQAKILMAQGELEAARALAAKQPYDGFDSYYQEILGDIAARQNAVDQAKIHYQAAIDAMGSAAGGYKAVLSLKLNRLPVDPGSAETAILEDPEQGAQQPLATGENTPGNTR